MSRIGRGFVPKVKLDIEAQKRIFREALRYEIEIKSDSASRRVEADHESTELRAVTAAMLNYMVRWEAWTLARPRRQNASITCYLAWELEACLSDDLEGNARLGDFLTITGTSTDAYATTCEAWVRQEWGEMGLSVLEATCEALVHGSFNSNHLSIILGQMDSKETVRVRIGYPEIGDIVTALQTLTWLAVTFRDPANETLCCSSAVAKLEDNQFHIALQPLVTAESDPTSSCWHSLLGSSIVACGFSAARVGGGLELPFSLMLELTGMIYGTDRSIPFRIPTREHSPLESESTQPHIIPETKRHESIAGFDDESGVFFTGVHSVLFPTQHSTRRNIMKWHYAASNTVMTPPKEGTWLQLHHTDLLNTRTVIGYTPEVQVHLGTAERSLQYDKMRSSSAEVERDGWHFTLDGLTPQLGFTGNGISFPVKLVRRKGQKVAPSARPTYDQITSETANTPIIVFDTTSARETAWLVSQLSVILDLVLFQVRREGWWDNLSDDTRRSLHASPHWNGGSAAQAVLNDHTRANTTLKLSADDGKPIAIKHLVIDIFNAMSIRSQVDQQNPSHAILSTPPLLGWDLLQLTSATSTAKRLQLEVHKSSSGNNSIPTWLPLARELPVYFCDGLGDIMTSAVPLCSEFQHSRKHLFANLHVLSTKLKRCAKCSEYHVDTKEQLVWKNSLTEDLAPCDHGSHAQTEARARFDDDVQLLVPANHKFVAPEAVPRQKQPQEGAFVFGPKRLKTKGRS